MKKILLACLLCMGIMVGCGGPKDETYDITVNNTGKQYSTATEFYQAYSSSMLSIGNDLTKCSQNIGSNADVSALNKCKKGVADELQTLVDLQGPTDKADKEKTMDDLIVDYNNDIIQSISSDMKTSDFSDFQTKISDWQQKMAAALVAYQK